MNPREIDDRAYVRDYLTQYLICCGPQGSIAAFQRSFSDNMRMKANDPWGMTNIVPGAWLAGFMKGATRYC